MQTKPLIDRPTLEQIVDRAPLQVPPDATILDAILLMSQGQQSCVLVVDRGSLVGIFTERDAVRPIASGMDLATTEIARAIEQPAIHLILDRNQNLSTALSLMRQHRIYHLPAIDELGNLVGLVTRDRVEEAIASLESVEDSPRQQLEIELELRLRQQQFASLLENSPDIIFRLDLELRHIYISPSVIETSGLYPQEFLGKTGRELGLPASACDVFEGACREAIATGELTRVEYEIADRQYISRLIPERSANGAIESLMGITEEIGNRQRQEAIAAANLKDTQLLQDLSARLTSETDIQVLYDEILRAAI
ncbi:MAG: CBS domain-containing protein, partial [Microcoleus sp.]